ncbi:hypothetical protein TNCV_2465401 [Trichonephila clavipes]|uniref:Uncharacterized protein n=1 Tax=Trichonephila clavipes TaxID=2585209 RepID=A0A8X6UXE9_TRICX|nr:hypothetical protein TNCV_2465401 [Trichonephila clavipes]
MSSSLVPLKTQRAEEANAREICRLPLFGCERTTDLKPVMFRSNNRELFIIIKKAFIQRGIDASPQSNAKCPEF